MNDKIRENISRYQDESYAQKYKEEYKGGYRFKNIKSRIIANREIAVTRSLLEDANITKALGALLLDVPCGTGKIGKILSRYPIKILAGDLSSQMMALAAHEYSTDKFIGFLRFNAQNIPLNDKSVDYIVCLRLFQRLPKDIRINVLREFRRVLKHNLIVSYSYISPFQNLRNGIRRLYDREKQDFYQESIAGIRLELNEAGFILKSIKHVLFSISSEIIILCETK